MKNFKIFSILTIALGLAFGACSGDQELPPISYPNGLDASTIGSGTWDDPMSAAQVATGATVEGRSSAWVTGYIVGWIDTDNGNQVVLSAEGAGATNLVLASVPEPGVEDTKFLCSVQLPSGGVRDALNLQANPDNLGKQVTVKGSLGVKYCSLWGVKSTSEYKWGAEGNYEAPIGDGAPVDQLWMNFEESASIDYYTERYWNLFNEEGTLSGWYIKNFGGTNYATVSAYLGSADGGPYVNWLITPALDMDAMQTKTLTFTSQVGYEIAGSSLEVYILEGSNDPLLAEKVTKLDATIATGGTTGYSKWAESGTIDLSAFSGTCYIGWRYYSEKGGNNNSATYCIDDINIGDAPEISAPKEMYCYEQVTSVVSGEKYLIVGNGSEVANALTGSYGYLYVTSTTPEDGCIYMPDDANAYTFAETEKGWTMTTKAGKMLGIQTGYPTYVTTAPEDSYWKIEPQEDGTFLIYNECIANSVSYMEYSVQYSSFGAYNKKDTGLRPTLWRFKGTEIR